MKGLTHTLMGFPGPSSIPHTVHYTDAELIEEIKARVGVWCLVRGGDGMS